MFLLFSSVAKVSQFVIISDSGLKLSNVVVVAAAAAIVTVIIRWW